MNEVIKFPVAEQVIRWRSTMAAPEGMTQGYFAPKRATEGSAGFDLRACIDQPLRIHHGERVLVPTGIAIHIKDPTLVGLIVPRSGLGHKHGIVLGNGVGVIDSDYQGTLFVSLWHTHEETLPFTVNPGDRIAQLLVMPLHHVAVEHVESFDEQSARGAGGFGSTGTE